MLEKVIKSYSLPYKSFITLIALAMMVLVVAFPPWNHDTGIKASSATEWSVPMTVASGSEGSNSGLEFGVRELATDGLDAGVDVLHPPPFPGTTFRAYFQITGPVPSLSQLDKDYRGLADTIHWTLNVKSESEDITVTWDAKGLPLGCSAYMNTGTNTIDMLGHNSLPAPLPAGEHTLVISIETGENSATQTPLPTHTLSPTPTLTQTLIPTATPVSTPSATITPGPPSTPPPPSGSSWSTGAVIGIGIGIFVVILLATFSGIWFMRRRRHGSVG